jgi:hypothetical protein
MAGLIKLMHSENLSGKADPEENMEQRGGPGKDVVQQPRGYSLGPET